MWQNIKKAYSPQIVRLTFRHTATRFKDVAQVLHPINQKPYGKKFR